MGTNIDKKLEFAVDSYKPAYVLVHADLMKGFKIKFSISNRKKFISDHFDKLTSVLGEGRIVMPVFNYQFLRTREANSQSPSEVGALSEYFRQEVAHWRTLDPVFSFAGTQEINYKDPVGKCLDIDPFGEKSFFSFLSNENSLLLHYGSEFKHSTIIHFVERKLGLVPYRYDKIFKGLVVDKEQTFEVSYRYHVRPMGKHLDYNWPTLLADLTREGILYSLADGSTRITYCSIPAMIDYLESRMKEDPYYLLDEDSKSWIKPMIEKLGRGFQIADFEPKIAER